MKADTEGIEKVSGQYFSKYCGQNYCNAIQCHFIFEKAGGVSVKAVDATVINDKVQPTLHMSGVSAS